MLQCLADELKRDEYIAEKDGIGELCTVQKRSRPFVV